MSRLIKVCRVWNRYVMMLMQYSLIVFFRSGLLISTENSSIRLMYFCRDGSLAVRSSMLEIFTVFNICWKAASEVPGVAVRARILGFLKGDLYSSVTIRE